MTMTQEELIRKADAIGQSIAASDYVSRYWQAKDKMGRNHKAQELFEALKLKTNHKLGLEQSLGTTHPKVEELNRDIEALERELYEIPVAMQYKESQAELNDVMQGIIQQLLTRLSGHLPVEPGPRVGCGKGPDGNGCNCGGSH